MPSATNSDSVSESNNSRSLRKTTQMFVKIILFFILTWLPSYIMVIMDIAGYQSPMSAALMDYFTMLGFTNWGMNFFIYGIFSKHFRLAYKRLLCFYLPVTDDEMSIMTV